MPLSGRTHTPMSVRLEAARLLTDTRRPATADLRRTAQIDAPFTSPAV
jgi:hypothetical protein